MTGKDFAAHLLGNTEFRRQHLNREFWMCSLPGHELGAIFSWDQLNACLSFNRITNDRFRLSTENEHLEANRRVFRPVKDALGRNTDYLVMNELHMLMREGVTAVLEAVNELSSNVADITDRLGAGLGAQSTANAYVSFGETSGFGVHNDDHDVLILQIDGRKKWQFFKSSTRSSKARISDIQTLTEADLGEEIVISAGDVMFIPKGTWHNVMSINENSLHLTISLVYPTVSDFIKWALDQERFGILFSDIHPTDTDHKAIIDSCRDYFSQFIHRNNIDTFIRTFYANRASSRILANFPPR